MKRLVLLVGLILLLLLAVVGCGSEVEPLRPMPKGEDQVSVGGEGFEAVPAEPTERDFSGAPVGTWIYPGKVVIGNLYPGARAEETISIHNGGDVESTFLVYYENLTQEKDGYSFAPLEIGDWLRVSDASPIIGPGEVVDVLVVLEVPRDAVVNVDKFGFLVVVSEGGQEGMIKVRNSSKWLVEMRK